MIDKKAKSKAKLAMRAADVRARVTEIASRSGDPAGAHGAEDDLWHDVLQAIAGGAPRARELAREALKTQDIRFHRWCA